MLEGLLNSQYLGTQQNLADNIYIPREVNSSKDRLLNNFQLQESIMIKKIGQSEKYQRIKIIWVPEHMRTGIRNSNLFHNSMWTKIPSKPPFPVPQNEQRKGQPT